jgi:hypothetical protein
MVADSQPDAATACAVLPGSFGPGPLPAVIRIPGNYTITLRYRTDEQALQALLPLSLTVAEPVISFRCRRAEGIEWADGTSHFAGAADREPHRSARDLAAARPLHQRLPDRDDVHRRARP